MEREPTPPVEGTPPASPTWAFFSCSGQGFALRLDRIREIVPPQPLTRLPGCGPAVCGLVGLRGRVVTVFDLGVLTGGEPAAGKPDHRLLLVRHRSGTVGLAVDELVTIAALPDTTAGAEADEEGSGPGVLLLGGREFNVLEPDRVLGPLLA